jgi:uncharacterized protein YndB with AHSA1/START domain
MMSDLDLIITRRIAASPDRVYRCWTEPALLQQWIAPKPLVTRDLVMDLRPGGRFYFLMVLPDGTELPNEGCVLAAEPNRRLVFTQCLTEGFRPAENPMLPMTAEMTFEADGTGTLYTARVIHGSAAFRDKHVEMGFYDGWGAASAQLEELALTL